MSKDSGFKIKLITKISKIFRYFIVFFTKIDQKLNSSIKEELPYKDLTPTDQCDNENVYCNALEWSIGNNNITNIALTGSYGSGKSSILKKFQLRNPQLTYLSISLASFLECKKDDNKPNGQDTSQVTNGVSIEDNLIELSILQQMSYRVKGSKVPDSRIRRTNKRCWWVIALQSTGLVIWLTCLSILFEWNKNSNHLIYGSVSNDYKSYITLLVLGIVILGAILILYKFIRTFTNSKLNKLNIQSGEIELAEEANPSILNKHLDEILYNFEVNKYDVVIIEDLDRFDNTGIFTKLREINLLINNSLQVNYRTIFLYAIKDDLFVDNKERTKFFDFIIPVIPVINASNSGTELMTRLHEYNIDEKFIHEVSFFISDMRLLNNIINEFIIYRKNITNYSPEKFLGIIIYKNIMPKDFIDMHNYEGIVYELFKQKNKRKLDIDLDYTDKINELKKRIEIAKETIPLSLKELNLPYIIRCFEEIGFQSKLRLDGNLYTIKSAIEIYNTDLSDIFKSQSRISYNTQNQLYYQSSNYDENSELSFNYLESQVSNVSYSQRAKIITDGVEHRVFRLKLEIMSLLEQKKKLKSYTLAQIIEYNKNYEFGVELEKQDCVKYLLRNGYICENFHQYVSIFKEGRYSRNDYNYILAVNSERTLPNNHKLKNVDNIIAALPPLKFSLKESLNHMMVDHLCLNKTVYEEQFYSTITCLSDNSDDSFSFLFEYKIEGKHYGILLKALCQKWTQFWGCLQEKKYIVDNELNEYLVDIFKYLDIDDIIGLDNNYELGIYLESLSELPDLIANEFYDKLEAFVIEKDVVFSKIATTENNKWVNFIYYNNRYEINSEMVNYMISHYKKDENVSKYNYSVLSKLSDNHLLDYVNKNIESYIKKIYLSYQHQTNEGADELISLLNNESIPTELKVDIILKNKTIIEDINIVKENKLWKVLMNNRNAKATWNNIISYFSILEVAKFDESILKYLQNDNSCAEILNIQINESEYDTDTITAFSKVLIAESELDIGKYKILNSELSCTCTQNELETLQEDKIQWLLDNKRLEFNNEILNILYGKSDELYLSFITINQVRFIEDIESINITVDKLLKLLKHFDAKFNISLIRTLNLADSELSPELADLICDIYINESDYLDFESSICIVSNIRDISRQLKIMMLYIKLGEASTEEIDNLLTTIGNGYEKIAIKDGLMPSLPSNEDNLQLRQLLIDKKYIKGHRNRNGLLYFKTHKKE